MIKFTVNTTVCKGCGLCVDVCPRKLLKLDADNLNEKGYAPASMTDATQCIGCAFCARTCPDCAITIEKIDK